MAGELTPARVGQFGVRLPGSSSWEGQKPKAGDPSVRVYRDGVGWTWRRHGPGATSAGEHWSTRDAASTAAATVNVDVPLRSFTWERRADETGV